MKSKTDAVKADLMCRLDRYTIAWETIPGEPYLIGVGVFGVPREESGWVRQVIAETEERFLPDGELGLIPLIRDLKTTTKHYPQHMRTWAPTHATTRADGI